MAQRKAAIHSLPLASRTRALIFEEEGVCTNKAPTSVLSSFTVGMGGAQISREVGDATVLYLFGVIGATVPPTD